MFLKNALDSVKYRFTSGDRYLWNSYGPDAVYLDIKDVQDRPIGSILFDSSSAEVYEITVEVPGEALCYRWINPDFENLYRKEAESKGINPDIAWDDVIYTDIIAENDILNKLEAIFNCREFDRTISVPLYLTQDEELELYRQAHAADMSTNEYVNMALRKQIDALKKQI
jgi:hypothetical protein